MSDAPTKDGFKAIWQDDKLDRQRDAEIIRQFTLGHLDLRERAGLTRTYVLNLDADWGSGKTFFLEKLKAHLEHHGHIAVYINAWEDDYSAEPFLTVVDAIQAELRSKLEEVDGARKAAEIIRPLTRSTARVLGNALLSGGKHFVARYIGQEAIDGVAEALGKSDEWEDSSGVGDAIRSTVSTAVDLTGSELLENFNIQKDAQRKFREELTGISKCILDNEIYKAPIFVLIDELDRCRPSYAIELLERIKHLFSLENFVFILGTDTLQLSHAIRGFYGQDFDGLRYLRRFVDRTYKFQKVSKESFVQFKLERLGLSPAMFTLPEPYTVETYIVIVLEAVDCSLRDIEQILEIFATFKSIWPHGDEPIDLITLLHLSYLRHHRLSHNEVLTGPLKRSLTLNFKIYGRETAKPVDYIEVYNRATKERIGNVLRAENTFDEWVQAKRLSERNRYSREWGDYAGQPTTEEEYTSLLDLVATIHGDQSTYSEENSEASEEK